MAVVNEWMLHLQICIFIFVNHSIQEIKVISSNSLSKAQKYSAYYYIKLRKAANSHIKEGQTREHLAFCLKNY